MGIFDRFRTARELSSTQFGILSPYQPAPNWPSFVTTDIFGEMALLPFGRAEAITIPAVSKARNLLVATIAKFPLVAMRGDVVLPDADQPSFLYRTDSNVTTYERMAWTIDDLIFYGASLWLLKRGAPDAKSGRRPILDAEWCPPQYWKITEGHILVDDQEVDDADIILFNSPFEGLLNVAARTIRGARDQEVAWAGRAKNPVPIIELHQDDDTLTEEEVKPFVEAWAAARTAENGAIGYTPPGLKIITHGEVKADLMTEGRNAIRTDIGSFLNIRASMLDGTMGIDSLTYSTTEGEKNSFFEIDLPFWTDPIEARLSMDDVVPRGQRVRFQKYQANPAITGPNVED